MSAFPEATALRVAAVCRVLPTVGASSPLLMAPPLKLPPCVGASTHTQRRYDGRAAPFRSSLTGPSLSRRGGASEPDCWAQAGACQWGSSEPGCKLGA